MEVKKIVAGGTPTFPIHSKRDNIEVSPGTSLIWDERYGELFEDLNFLHAGVLVGSVISRPSEDVICLNFGHKSVASEMEFPRLKLLNMKNFKQISHSEEHLVCKCDKKDNINVGDICYGIPMHICPTVPKYKKVLTVVDNEGSNVITNTDPEYAFDSIDFNTGKVTLTNGTILYIESIDYNTGETEISYQGDFETPNPILVILILLVVHWCLKDL